MQVGCVWWPYQMLGFSLSWQWKLGPVEQNTTFGPFFAPFTIVNACLISKDCVVVVVVVKVNAHHVKVTSHQERRHHSILHTKDTVFKTIGYRLFICFPGIECTFFLSPATCETCSSLCI